MEDKKVEASSEPELMGSIYVGPQLRGSKDVDGKPDMDGHVTEISGARGVVRSLEELRYDEIKIDDDTTHCELDSQSGRQGIAGSELDDQSRRRGAADAELDGRERERRAADMDAGRLQQQRIQRKQVPARGQSYVSDLSPRSSPGPDPFPHSPIRSRPIPDITSMYPSPSDPEAIEEERKLERQAQRLRERREQLAREEAALQERLAQRGSGA